MANFVIKKDGTKVAFDAEKIRASVMAAAAEAEVADDQASGIADEVVNAVSASFESQEEVAANAIRDKILSELDVSAPTVAQAWRRYEESKGS